MIQLNNISLAYGEKVLFNAIAGQLRSQKIGLVGRNGAGKSTLLKVIAGLTQLDEGSVSIERDKTIAYMPQELVIESKKNVFDEAYSVFETALKLEQEKEQLEQKLETASDNAVELADRYSTILEQLTLFDKAKSLARTEELLLGIGFTQNMWHTSVTQLSTGWKMRLVLVKLLLQDADFYLFDEPTNHLDIVSKEWFCEFLKSFRGGFLMATHDRHFLTIACDHIFELERGNGTLFTGNFNAYLQQKEAIQSATHAAYNRQQREITRKQRTIDRFRASASKARQAQSMIKQLDRMERIEIEPPLPTVNIKLKTPERPGKIVLDINNVSFAFDDKKLFTNACGTIMRGQKIALVAANGVGKTTLFNLIANKYKLLSGTIEQGHNVHMALFEQDQTRVLKPESTIFEEVISAVRNVSDAMIRSLLGAFLFSGDDIHKKIKVLSGGERNRVAMVKVVLQNANFLLLDEPTNHLDLYAKEVLLQTLQQYNGTMLFVSHDHDFIEKLATDIWELTPNGINVYEGDYESYLWRKKQEEQSQDHTPHALLVKKPETPRNTKKDHELKKACRKLENKINKLEKKLEQLSNELIQHTYGSAEYKKIETTITQTQQELATTAQEWQSMYEQLNA